MPTSETWSQFRERLFGTEYDIWHDGGIDPSAPWTIKKEKPEHVLAMLQAGLEEGDYVAAMGLRLVEGEAGVDLAEKCLKELGKNEKFDAKLQVELAQYLQEKRPGQDYSAYVLDMAKHSSFDVRLYAAVALRFFHAEKVREPILALIGGDPDFFVRVNSLDTFVRVQGLTAADVPKYEEWAGRLGRNHSESEWAKVAEELASDPQFTSNKTE